jgi:membrane protein
MTIVTIIFALIILANGELIMDVILKFLRMEEMSSSIETLWLGLRWPVGFLMYLLMVSYNYYLLPTEKVEFKKVMPGSVFASVGMLLVTYIYSQYTSSLANYDVLYGALSSVVAIMMWFYFIAWVICLGVLCNKVWDDTSGPASKMDPPEHLKFSREEIKKYL